MGSKLRCLICACKKNLLGWVLRVFPVIVVSVFPGVTSGQMLGNGAINTSSGRLELIGEQQYKMKGAFTFQGYSGDGDRMLPAGRWFLSMYTYTNSLPTQPFCSSSGPAQLCNFSIPNGRNLSYIYDIINNIGSYNFDAKPPYRVTSNRAGADICAGWVLSKTTNAHLYEHSIGGFNCGVAPPNTSCDVSPPVIQLDMGTIQAGAMGYAEEYLKIKCTSGVNVRFKSLGNSNGGSGVVLTGAGSNLVSDITLNDKPGASGTSVYVNSWGQTSVSIKASVKSNNDSTGVYFGALPVIYSYE